MCMQEYLEKLEQEMQARFHLESSGHDINHLKRVYNLALHLQEKEGGDKLVIAVSAMVHDLHRVIEKEPGKYCSPEESLPEIKGIYDKIGLPECVTKKALHCVKYHEEYSFSETGKTVTDKETLILQDADNLDAIGAVGIARAFMFAGAKKLPMWIPEQSFEREHYEESLQDPTVVDHFKNKLLKLKDNMNTETAKKMAEKRHKFIEDFLDEFFKEWKGEK